MNISDPNTINAYYQALIDRAPEYLGIFYVGVKTTNVFCISTCRARKPKFENVVFYKTIKDVMGAGFRPCKVCRPTENPDEVPDDVKAAIALVREHPKEKISDVQLKQQNIRPERLRRWFKSHYGMTFHAYQRMYRINNAFTELKTGRKSIDIAFDSGYESLSGFGYTYKKLIGDSPSDSIDRQVILINRITTPLGAMFICATDQGICLLEFVDRKMLETQFKNLQRLLRSRIIIGENTHITQARQEIEEYFAGTRKQFDVALHTPGSEFQNTVWQCLQTVRFGETISYQEQATKMNKPKAVRAVATANGHNRISIIIPCHRVIGKDGSLTGYGGGLERKQWLLDHERRNA